LNIQDELAQRDRKHRDKYTGENKRHLKEVETITRTGETDQDVTKLSENLKMVVENGVLLRHSGGKVSNCHT
jgi:hypothetical protein